MSSISKSAEQAGAQAPAKAPIAACRKCGSKHFNVIETYAYNAELSEDEPSTLVCGKPDGGIDIIECPDCGEQYTCDDFSDINFH